MFYFFSKALKFLIAPMTYICFLPFVFLLFYKRKKIFKWCWPFYFAFILTLLSPIPRYLLGNLESSYPIPKKVEKLPVAVILSGHSLYKSREKSVFQYQNAFSRLAEGLRLLKLNQVDKIITFNGNNKHLSSDWYDEGVSLLKWAKEFDISADKIELLGEVLNTKDEVKRVLPFLKEKGIKKFYLVTNAYHMKRSMAIFKKNDITPVAYPVGHFINTISKKTKDKWGFQNIQYMKRYIHELVGYWSYKFAGFL